jgi:beta-glucosidase
VDLDSWQVEGGSYEISIGHSSADLALAATIAVEGTVTASAPSEPAVYRDAAVRVSSDEDFADLLRRPVPVAAWGRGPLGYNDPIDRIATARSGLARLVFRFLNARLRKAEASGHPDLNILFMFNAPFRVLSKMSGGLATRRLTDAVLTLVNGRTFRGIGAVIGAYLRGRRDEKRTAAEFRADGTRSERTR